MKKAFVFENISVQYANNTEKAYWLIRDSFFFFKKHAMTFLLYGKTSFKCHQNNY
jgi:hypothetical protein